MTLAFWKVSSLLDEKDSGFDVRPVRNTYALVSNAALHFAMDLIVVAIGRSVLLFTDQLQEGCWRNNAS